MMFAELIHSDKLGIFLGASLAIHVAVLGSWPTLPSLRTSGTTSRSIQMWLKPAADNRNAKATSGATSAAEPPMAVPAQPSPAQPETVSRAGPVPVAQSLPAVSARRQHRLQLHRPTPAPRTVARRTATAPVPVSLPVAVPEQAPAPAPAPAPIRKPPRTSVQSLLPQVTTTHIASVQPALLNPRDTRPGDEDRASTPASLSAAHQQLANAADTVPSPRQAVADEIPVGRDLSRLIALLHTQILQHRRYPVMAKRQRREGVATIRFDLYPSGELQDVRLDHSSGYQALDRAALQAVERIAPLNQARNFLSQARNFSVNVVFKLR